MREVGVEGELAGARLVALQGVLVDGDARHDVARGLGEGGQETGVGTGLAATYTAEQDEDGEQSLSVYAYVRVCMPIYVRVCMPRPVCVCLGLCVYVSLSLCVCVCVCLCVCR